MAMASQAAVLAAERRSLHTYMVTMLALAVVGFVVYAVTRVSATQLDGVISLINAAAAFIAARLAVASSRPADAENPYGRLALENLYALFRSLMILGVVVIAVVTNAIKVIDYLSPAPAASRIRSGRCRHGRRRSDRDGPDVEPPTQQPLGRWGVGTAARRSERRQNGAA